MATNTLEFSPCHGQMSKWTFWVQNYDRFLTYLLSEQIVDDNGELVLLDNKGNVIRGETKELLKQLKKNIIEEELRVEEEERRRLQEEGMSDIFCVLVCLTNTFRLFVLLVAILLTV